MSPRGYDPRLECCFQMVVYVGTVLVVVKAYDCFETQVVGFSSIHNACFSLNVAVIACAEILSTVFFITNRSELNEKYALR